MKSSNLVSSWSLSAGALLGLVVLSFLLYHYSITAQFLANRETLEINLHSTAEADYAGEVFSAPIPPLDLSIIADILRDHDPSAPDLVPRVTALAALVLTPVETVTLLPPSSTFSVSPSPGPSQTPGPSATITQTPTDGPSPTPSKSATLGPSPTATKTATAGPSSTPTRTPTVTRTPTLGPSSTATRTQTPSPTPSFTPTNTIVIPTMTSTSTPSQTPDVCSMISVSNFWIDDKDVYWTINNNSPVNIQITAIFIDWPVVNEHLHKISLNGAKIWDQDSKSPPSSINSDWESGSRVIPTSQALQIDFEYKKDAGSTGYLVVITFDNGCQAQKSN